MPTSTKPGEAGDRIQVSSPSHDQPRRGVIAEVLGRPGHAHYRVLWNDGGESIHYPSDGTRILRRPAGDRFRG
jgi:hypothetical protein